MKWYSIGSLSFPATWAAIVISFVITIIYLTVLKKKTVANVYGDAVFLFLLAWKLSVILFQFKMVIANPLTILYFNGGMKGYWTGAVLALCFAAYKSRKLTIGDYGYFLAAWMVTFAAFELALLILLKEQLLIGAVQFAGNMLFLFLVHRKMGDRMWLGQTFILFTGFQGFVYSLKGSLFSVPVYTCIIAFFILGLPVLKRR